MLNIPAMLLYTFCAVKLNMWSWNQWVLMVSRQSPGTLLMPPLSAGPPARGSVAAVLMGPQPPRTIGEGEAEKWAGEKKAPGEASVSAPWWPVCSWVGIVCRPKPPVLGTADGRVLRVGERNG